MGLQIIDVAFQIMFCTKHFGTLWFSAWKFLLFMSLNMTVEVSYIRKNLITMSAAPPRIFCIFLKSWCRIAELQISIFFPQLKNCKHQILYCFAFILSSIESSQNEAKLILVVRSIRISELNLFFGSRHLNHWFCDYCLKLSKLLKLVF